MKIQFKRKKKGNVREDLQNQTMQIGALRNWLEINQQYDLLDAIDSTLNEIWDRIN